VDEQRSTTRGSWTTRHCPVCDAVYAEGRAKGDEMEMTTKALALHFWTDGDRSVGLYGHSASVCLDGDYDAEFIMCAKELLQPAFQELFDDGKCHCATDEELEI
jgi:hypothetical protein